VVAEVVNELEGAPEYSEIEQPVMAVQQVVVGFGSVEMVDFEVEY